MPSKPGVKASSAKSRGERRSWNFAWLLAGLLALGPAMLFFQERGQVAQTATDFLRSLQLTKPLDYKGKARDLGASSNPAVDQLFSNLRQRPSLHADPLKTTRCADNQGVTDGHGRQRPLVQYALMIDAGSTGSRIHVYKVRVKISKLAIVFAFTHIFNLTLCPHSSITALLPPSWRQRSLTWSKAGFRRQHIQPTPSSQPVHSDLYSISP